MQNILEILLIPVPYVFICKSIEMSEPASESFDFFFFLLFSLFFTDQSSIDKYFLLKNVNKRKKFYLYSCQISKMHVTLVDMPE